jgi:hypothetical protein
MLTSQQIQKLKEAGYSDVKIRAYEAAKAGDAGAPAGQPAGESQTALMDPDVTEGLKQLLGEWGPFRSSGIFGLGAAGVDHPLYKKLASLPVMEVVSGRWEGSDMHITNDIREYIEAWRHEHGIEPDPEEQFDTYLRRVIRRIIHATPA